MRERARADCPKLSFTLVGEDSDGPLLFVRATRESADGGRQIANLLLQADQGRPPLRLLGELPADVVPRLGLDADGDGQLEVLGEPGARRSPACRCFSSGPESCNFMGFTRSRTLFVRGEISTTAPDAACSTKVR
jgi:hypothetical protein